MTFIVKPHCYLHLGLKSKRNVKETIYFEKFIDKYSTISKEIKSCV